MESDTFYGEFMAKSVQSILNHLQSPKRPSAIIILSCQNHMFMARSHKQCLPQIEDSASIRAICYSQMVNIK